MAIDLRKQTEAASASEPSNPSNNNNSVGRAGIGIDINANQDLGTWGGINVEAEARVSLDIEAEIRSQGLTFNTDPNTGSMSLGAGLGSAKGKLGGNIGVELGVNDQGEIEITGAKGEISIAGFGGNIEVNRDGSGSLGAEIGGFGVEVSRDENGKPSLTLSYGFGPGEVSITFSPDEEKEVPGQGEPDPVAYDPNPNNFPLESGCVSGIRWSAVITSWWGFPIPAIEALSKIKESQKEVVLYYNGSIKQPGDNLATTAEADAFFGKNNWTVIDRVQVNVGEVRSHWQNNSGGMHNSYIITIRQTHDYSLYVDKAFASNPNASGLLKRADNFQTQIVDCKPPPRCPAGDTPIVILPPTNVSIKPLLLPNYPQHPKRMDCCDKIEDIYKYLGIAKLKKHKFKVAKQFLAPGGKGTEDAEDYYQITQALFRMLANGLILNPKSKPLGSEWQNVNATAWASQMYEMMAESMSDGNSTQRVEVSTIMQLVQMMSLLAETSRKVELIIDALDIEPNLVSEELPVCFTIHESHKGFGKKEPKKIDTTKLKTDNDVEAVLGKMLVPSKVPIVKWEFKPGSISVIEALKNNGN